MNVVHENSQGLCSRKEIFLHESFKMSIFAANTVGTKKCIHFTSLLKARVGSHHRKRSVAAFQEAQISKFRARKATRTIFTGIKRNFLRKLARPKAQESVSWWLLQQNGRKEGVMNAPDNDKLRDFTPDERLVRLHPVVLQTRHLEGGCGCQLQMPINNVP